MIYSASFDIFTSIQLCFLLKVISPKESMNEARHYGSLTFTVTPSLKRDLCSASFRTGLVEDPLRAGYNAGLRRRLCNNSRQGELHPPEVALYTTCQHIHLLRRYWHCPSFEMETKKIIFVAFKWSVSDRKVFDKCDHLYLLTFTPSGIIHTHFTQVSATHSSWNIQHTQPWILYATNHQFTNFCNASHMYDVPL